MTRQIPTPPKPADEMSDQEKAVYRAQLEAALDAITPTVVADTKPGDPIGEGFAREYVPYTREWFLDIETRRKDIGSDGNLQWPNYQLHDVMHNGAPTIVKIQGVPFGLLPGRICKLPTPHYNEYLGSLEKKRRDSAEFDPPDKPQQFTVYRQIGQWDKAPEA